MIRPFPSIRHLASLVALGAILGLNPARADDPARKPEAPKRPIEVLEKTWPNHPEWVAMLVDILQGSQLDSHDGWFRKAVSKTRFTWDATRARFDKDGDGAISRFEFAGPVADLVDPDPNGPHADFDRLDRDHDQRLTAADFDFSPHALSPSPGMMLFYAADRDGDGRVTAEEFEGVFRALDRDGVGFLSQDDLRRAFAPRPASRTIQAGPSGPSRSTLVKGLFRQEIGSLLAGPELNVKAPDFTLKTLDGADVTLSKLVGPKPVVLVFGNFTCGPFRGQAGNVEKLYRKFKDRATFIMIYVREAHPTDGWHMESNDRSGVSIRQPQTFDERLGVAQTCGRTLHLGFPMVVDSIDDAVGARYSGMPARLYLIDGAGTVAYKSGRGPFGFKPAELEQSLVLLLAKPRQSPAPATSKR